MSAIQTTTFGLHNGQEIHQYTLQNSKGMEVKIIEYGATITSIKIPDAASGMKNIVCGFDNFSGYFGEAYLENAPYFGCTVGRYASRIKNGRFSIDGQEYSLAINNGSNHLHGGMEGFDKKVWKGEVIAGGNASLQMNLESGHLEEGYPGNVSLKVIFSLNDENELSITYEAHTDQTTPLSLTNHTYFNLSGFKATIENHHAKINSATILAPDETNVPVGVIEEVKETAADLQEGRLLGACFQEMETGFEHYYLFNKPLDSLAKVAEFSDTKSGTKLEIMTTEPGALFYTGYFTSYELKRENSDQYGRYRGLCFETSRYPNGPNLPVSPKSVTQPDEVYQSQTIFKISDPLLS